MSEMIREAVISKDEMYRYRLYRTWDVNLPKLMFIMLNPSTADGTKDDPTIRRCISFAQKWGFGSIAVGNLFACRSTAPDLLQHFQDPIGRDNDHHLCMMLIESRAVVCAWGAHPIIKAYPGIVIPSKIGLSFRCLGITKSGAPRHPLYVPSAIADTIEDLPIYTHPNII